MSDIILLDCTLRDGGYVNDWEFGHNNLLRIYERLCDSGVDAIELGFIDDRRPFDHNRSIFPDTASIREIWSSSAKRPAMTVGMIDYGTCAIENIEPAEESFIDTIRVIFKEHLMHEAMEYCAEIKKLGYRVCAQLVAVTSYTDETLKELINLVNDVHPYAVSMVDTYGLLNPGKLLHIDRLLDALVEKDIRIGFHAHNNLQLAYANNIAFLDAGHQHDILVDGTLYGMGKSAGNAPIELLAMYLNENYGKRYRIDPMLESIEESVMDYYARSPWGYKMFYYLSAKNRCHPSYVGDYQRKENLSVTKLDEALSGIQPTEKKILYDRTISEESYTEYLTQFCDESVALKALREEWGDGLILLVGPGKNILRQGERVQAFISENHPKIISINYIPERIETNYVFVTNRYRYQQMTDALHEKKNQGIRIIATGNVNCVDGEEAYMLNRAPLLEVSEPIKDNSLLMLLRVLKKVGVRKVYCAGFDGYSSREDNYFNPGMEYAFAKDSAQYLNRHIREVLRGEYADMEISFVTYSHYEEEEDSHFAAF